MVIRQTLTQNTEALEGIIGFLEDYEDFAYGVFQETANEIAPHVLDELRDEPGKPTYPIQWTSEKQRRAFFATDGFGGGIPYRRTGKLAKAWIAEARRDGDSFLFVIENPAKAAPFVYGSLAQNRTSALRFQQRFHANTGWQPATDTVAFWQEAFREQFTDKLDEQTVEGFKRRAFTRTR